MRDHVNSAKKRRQYVNQRWYEGGGFDQVSSTSLIFDVVCIVDTVPDSR